MTRKQRSGNTHAPLPKHFKTSKWSAVIFFLEVMLSLILGLDDPSTVQGSFAIIAKAGLLSCCFVCMAPFVPGMRWVGKNAMFLACGIVVLGGITLPYLWVSDFLSLLIYPINVVDRL